MLIIVSIMSEFHHFDSNLGPFFTKNDLVSIASELFAVDLISIIYNYCNDTIRPLTFVFAKNEHGIRILPTKVPIFKDLCSRDPRAISAFFCGFLDHYHVRNSFPPYSDYCTFSLHARFENVNLYQITGKLINPLVMPETINIYVHHKSVDKVISLLKIVNTLFTKSFANK